MYHEHHYYYSLTSINNLLSKYNLRIFDLDFLNVHGGSIRIYVSKNNSNFKSQKKVQKLLTKEKKEKLNDFEKLKLFQKKLIN